MEMPEGTVHKVPIDLREALYSNQKALLAWRSLTPLARNEWICWTISVKQKSTRDKHIRRVILELSDGVRRPCCWIGCIHRKDKALSPSVKWVLSNKPKFK